ncbi:hypothetical protein TWF102_002642 [Orbilia oligospora]|uniref:Uncharacterized protein n=1 Tax=Orbilia oligospora TaxID=2813651 RepID=A0A7C8JHL9_ORBOL|nr:hypothetical protein TWF706_007697 [Orbilia oligospora]KAF3104877.1 hypothetical protein TWF102_002642 [Orbilia oligospora]KAF3116207.1 hypothetical protein TWF103_009432 [Orbilia oligospora]
MPILCIDRGRDHECTVPVAGKTETMQEYMARVWLFEDPPAALPALSCPCPPCHVPSRKPEVGFFLINQQAGQCGAGLLDLNILQEVLNLNRSVCCIISFWGGSLKGDFSAAAQLNLYFPPLLTSSTPTTSPTDPNQVPSASWRIVNDLLLSFGPTSDTRHHPQLTIDQHSLLSQLTEL